MGELPAPSGRRCRGSDRSADYRARRVDDGQTDGCALRLLVPGRVSRGPASSATTLEEPVFSSTAGSKPEPITTSSKASSSSPVLEPTPRAKRGLDVALSATGLLLATPLGVLIALAIKLGDGGPVFFAQERVGKGGKHFRSFKFRSMIPNADGAEDPVQAEEHDPRVTPVGGVLRKTAMDELPQLWNIFRGDMSFVGPRALATHEAETGVVDSVGALGYPRLPRAACGRSRAHGDRSDLRAA